MGIIDKKQMTEEDIKLNCVSPECRRTPTPCFVSGNTEKKELF